MGRLQISGKPYSEAKIAEMVEEMDYEQCGLSMSTVFSALQVKRYMPVLMQARSIHSWAH